MEQVKYNQHASKPIVSMGAASDDFPKKAASLANTWDIVRKFERAQLDKGAKAGKANAPPGRGGMTPEMMQQMMQNPQAMQVVARCSL